MWAYMVDREHIDALVELFVWGPSNRPGGQKPGGRWRWGEEGMRWWVVAKETLYRTAFTVLARARGEARPDPEIALGAMLIAANLASIHDRYPDTVDGGTIPGPTAPYWQTPYVFRHARPAPTALEGLKLLAVYEYQLHENPAWPAAFEAHWFCSALRRRLIGELDGYAAAPSTWPARTEGRA